MMGGPVRLFLLLCISSCGHGANQTLEQFVGDIISTWKLLSPTIVVDENLLELCRTHQWVLCLVSDNEELARHLEVIHQGRKQDGIIFANEGQKELLPELDILAPSIFRSNYPIFMPIGYSVDINLRLDSNIIFFEEGSHGEYELHDIYEVKQGPTIMNTLGYWNNKSGIILQKSMNRWDRRTDLEGATFKSGVMSNAWAYFKRDMNGSIVGSEGYFQEMLFFITDKLNLTIETKELGTEYATKLENGSWTGWIGQLQRKEVDVVSSGVGVRFQRSFVMDYPFATARSRITLIAAIPKGAAPNMWVYVRVLGVHQLIVFVLALTLITILLSLLNFLLEDETSKEFGTKRGSRNGYQLDSTFASFALVSLYTIQMGSHTNSRKMTPRLLTLTASFITFLIFVAFSTKITAEMTSSPSEIPVRTFEDVIKHNYKIVTFSPYYAQLLRNAKPGTAKNIVYNSYLKELPLNKTERKAIFEVVSEPKTLWYTVFSATHSTNPKDLQYTNQFFALKMDDAVYGILTLGLQKDSEFLQVFNHYILKQFETGYSRRLYRKYHVGLFTKENYEVNEPQPLGFSNVMFCFILLALGICLSITITTVELMLVKQKKKKMWATRTNKILERDTKADGEGTEAK